MSLHSLNAEMNFFSDKQQPTKNDYVPGSLHTS